MSYNNEPSNSAWGGLYWQTDERTVYNRRPSRLAAAATTTTHKHDWRRSLQYFATVFYVDPRDRARGVLDSLNTTAHAQSSTRTIYYVKKGQGLKGTVKRTATATLSVRSRARGVWTAASGETLNLISKGDNHLVSTSAFWTLCYCLYSLPH